MEALRQNKTLLIVLAVTLSAAAVYYLMPSGGAEPGIESDFGSASADSREVLQTLQILEGIKLNVGLFETEAFLSLRDYTVFIAPVIPGRKNPFAPLPGYAPTPAGAPGR